MRWLGAAVVITLTFSSVADATYSIAAVDRSTRQVGGAATSCVGSFSVRTIYGVAVGRGVVHAQAQVNANGRDRAVTLLNQELAPSEIIAAITAPGFDPQAAARQYGVVDLDQRTAGYSGTRNGAYAGDRQGQLAQFAYSTQGNILTSVRVIDQAEQAFRAGGCDLAERLMRALEAGAQNAEGDSRCTPDGIPSDSAFIEVDLDNAVAGSYLRLEVRGTAPRNPISLLRAQFDAWRLTHPCPVLPPDAGVDVLPASPVSPSTETAAPSNSGTPSSTADATPIKGGCTAASGGWTFLALVWVLIARLRARTNH